MESKICVSCGNELSLADDFYDHPHPKDGKESVCKMCKRQRARQYYQKNLKTRKIRVKKDKPRAFSFNQDTLARIETTMDRLNLSTFSETMNHILDTTLVDKRYLTSNAFSRALSVLDKNLFEMSIIHKNLNQLDNAVKAGKAPQNDKTVATITTLTDENIRVTSRLIDLIRDIASAAP